MNKHSTLKKPTLSTAAVQAFAEGATPTQTKAVMDKGRSRAEIAPAGLKSGLVPGGDVRLTANIRGDLHLKLKIRAAQERTTIGELIEQWVEGWKP
jgi:hypothetical protein